MPPQTRRGKNRAVRRPRPLTSRKGSSISPPPIFRCSGWGPLNRKGAGEPLSARGAVPIRPGSAERSAGSIARHLRADPAGRACQTNTDRKDALSLRRFSDKRRLLGTVETHMIGVIVILGCKSAEGKGRTRTAVVSAMDRRSFLKTAAGFAAYSIALPSPPSLIQRILPSSDDAFLDDLSQ